MNHNMFLTPARLFLAAITHTLVEVERATSSRVLAISLKTKTVRYAKNITEHAL